ncbi:hypothetical protein D3C86_2058370 [compost metagenome]
MLAALNDTSLIQNKDLVSMTQRGDTMRNNEGRTTRHQLSEACLNLVLRLHVDGACRIVENKNARVFDQCSRNGDALLLSAG